MRGVTLRILGLTFACAMAISIVGLGATKTFINKTGKMVTGITVTFSKRVMITRHDALFHDQSLSGRSNQFKFIGGNLHNLGRFSFSWMPSSARITYYEWIEKPGATTPTITGTSAPTYEEIMAKVAHYPGPDEPLYQPKPDDEIWLTDLDGHGGIYDNDSIRINYAPGFDRSQITKIDVYRNGIKLRFLPETLDVLTNVQMKTFDGNPLERIPASSHTDHAIYGYLYQFGFHGQNGEVIRKLEVAIKSPFHFGLFRRMADHNVIASCLILR